jgi:hypothetical protein
MPQLTVPYTELTAAELVWAISIIVSRSAYRPVAGGGPHRYVLVPFFDIFNHDIDANAACFDSQLETNSAPYALYAQACAQLVTAVDETVSSSGPQGLELRRGGWSLGRADEAVRCCCTVIVWTQAAGSGAQWRGAHLLLRKEPRRAQLRVHLRLLPARVPAVMEEALGSQLMPFCERMMGSVVNLVSTRLWSGPRSCRLDAQVGS